MCGNADTPFAIIDLQWVIYDEVRWAFRVDKAGVKALFGNGIPHGCQVHHGRYSTVKKTPEEEK